MTSDSPTPASIKWRQYGLLALVIAAVVGAASVGVALTGSKADTKPQQAAKTTTLLAPGAHVDPRDAWRGQADAQMKALEQRAREIDNKNSELELQSKGMIERLRKLEQSGLTSLPPPPVPAPVQRPEFGPDLPPKPSGSLPPPVASPQALGMPPGRPPIPVSSGAAAPTLPAIISITLNELPIANKSNSTSSAAATPDASRSAKPRGEYLPTGSFTRAVLLGGLDAPTGGQAQRNPQPVLLRLTDNAILPNRFRFTVKECFIVGAGYGDLSSERAYIRTETLSCVTHKGQAIDVPIKGYVAGEDGKAGMRGRLVSKQGQLLANALTAGIASGIGQAFQQGATSYSISPLGSTATVNQGEQLTAGIGSGVGRALDRLAQYYITLAEKVFPVIEVDAGRVVDVVVTQGAVLEGLTGVSSDADAGSIYPRFPSRRSDETQ